MGCTSANSVKGWEGTLCKACEASGELQGTPKSAIGPARARVSAFGDRMTRFSPFLGALVLQVSPACTNPRERAGWLAKKKPLLSYITDVQMPSTTGPRGTEHQPLKRQAGAKPAGVHSWFTYITDMPLRYGGYAARNWVRSLETHKI